MRRILLPAIAATIVLAMLASGASAQELIDYREQGLESGESMGLQQNYLVTLDWIKKDLGAVGIVVEDGSQRPLDELIMQVGDTRTVTRGGTTIMDITLQRVAPNSEGNYVAQIEVEQYRDPERSHPTTVLHREDFRVSSGEQRTLSDGYSIKATSDGQGDVEVLLFRNSIPLQRYSVSEGDVIVYSRTTESGREFTLLTAKTSTIFEDTKGNVNVVFSSLNQFQSPESGGYLQGPAAALTGVLVVAGVAIILLSLGFRRKQ